MLHLYHLNLRPSTNSIGCVTGVFDRERVQDIVRFRETAIDLVRISASGHMHVIRSETLFGQIRCVAPFKSPGSIRDSLAVLSDSGSLNIISFNSVSGQFDLEDTGVFGKSSTRRAVAGDYVACDPDGRAIMIAGIERHKLVYIIGKGGFKGARLSSPLEAHKSNSVTHYLCAIDVEFDNPVFASLESTNEAYVKELVYYELDLGLNHVTRRVIMETPMSAHRLIPLPRGLVGSRALLICCEDFLLYFSGTSGPPLRVLYPRRLDTPENYKLMICSSAVQTLKSTILIMIQSDLGDIYRIVISGNAPDQSPISISYFESLPRCSCMAIVKPGFLYVSFEVGGSSVYQFVSLGKDESYKFKASTPDTLVPFRPRALTNLTVRHDMPSGYPMLDLFVRRGLLGDSGFLRRGIIAACGQSTRSTVKSISFAAVFNELALTELPGKPSGIWTLKDGFSDKYIIVSFTNATLVLLVDEDITEVTDSGLTSDDRTVFASVLADGSKIQVCGSKVRQLGKEKASEWCPSRADLITCACCNGYQLLVGLSHGKVVLLEIDDTGELVEVAERNFGGLDVNCLGIQKERPGQSRGFVAVTGLSDGSMRILSLEPGKSLKQIAAQSLSSAPVSCCISDWGESVKLFVGLSSGSCFRCNLDAVTGKITLPVMDSLGERPCHVSSVNLSGENVILALSSFTHIYRSWEGKISKLLTQFQSTESLDLACSFSSSQCPQGLIGVFSNSLSISVAENIDRGSDIASLSVSYTPRRFCHLPVPFSEHGQSEFIAVLEAEHNAYNDETRSEIKRELSLIDLADEQPTEATSDSSVGTFMAGDRKWASCIRIINCITLESVFKLDLDVDETAVSFSICRFQQLKDMRPCLVIATCKGLCLRSRTSQSSFLKTYLYDTSYNLQLVHTTEIEDSRVIPSRVAEIRGRLLVSFTGIASLRVYELGKRKLLLKCEYTDAHSLGFIWLGTRENQIFTSDLSGSMRVLEFDESNYTINPICQDSCHRWITTGLILDAEVI